MRKPLTELNNVLTRVVSKLGLDQRLREHTFLSLWPTFVSGPIADRSRPIFIDAERNLVISVADAATGQELSMAKARVMSKVGPAAKSLGIEIRGIRLDLKHYHSTTTLSSHPLASDDRLPAPTEEELASATISAPDQSELSKLAAELEAQHVDEDTRTRMLKLFERECRVRSWRIEHGYPRCQRCDNPVERLHKLRNRLSESEFAMVCIACFYADKEVI